MQIACLARTGKQRRVITAVKKASTKVTDFEGQAKQKIKSFKSVAALNETRGKSRCRDGERVYANTKPARSPSELGKLGNQPTPLKVLGRLAEWLLRRFAKPWVAFVQPRWFESNTFRQSFA